MCVQEASLLTQLWTEAQAFGRDEDTICEYLVEYLRKWAGRGIPVPVDVLLAQRVSGNHVDAYTAVCTLAFGTVVSGVEDFASLLGGDRGFERSVARRQSFKLNILLAIQLSR